MVEHEPSVHSRKRKAENEDEDEGEGEGCRLTPTTYYLLPFLQGGRSAALSAGSWKERIMAGHNKAICGGGFHHVASKVANFGLRPPRDAPYLLCERKKKASTLCRSGPRKKNPLFQVGGRRRPKPPWTSPPNNGVSVLLD